jgi:GTP pyrophosphokinase
VKHAEINIEGLSPAVRSAVDAVGALKADVATAQSLELAGLLAGMQVGDELILAGLAVPLLQAGRLSPPDAGTLFGEPALQLATQLQRIGDSGIPAGWNPGNELRPEQAEGLRKLLLSLAADVRLVLLRIALQLVRLRALRNAGVEAQRRAAIETREIYAPLANRLGIWQLKWELEDLAFRFSEPEEYKRIAGWLRVKRDERERYIADVQRELVAALQAAGIRGEVTGRPKHIYSIWRKMYRKGLAFDQVMDVLAVRVIVDTVSECYAALGMVHGHWPFIPGEFDDYIATPKDNDYRSLHTAVIGPGKLPLEVQIRTRDMHDHAELGVAAHWQYKEGRQAEASFQQKINWLRQLLEPQHRAGMERDLLDGLQADIFDDRVYALSPKGEVVDLPKDATPLDFAYHVHTDLGHRCRGAKVNGRMVSLDHKLANGDTVEIITGKQPQPSRDWLSPQLGFLASGRNRAKVRNWFRKQDDGQNREQGRQLLEREIERLGVRNLPMPELLAELDLPGIDALHLGLGEGEITLAQVAGAIQRRLQAREPPRLPKTRPATAGSARSRGLVVDGVGDLLSVMAGCCKAVPHEPIAGYLTVGRGVSIHRTDCPNLLRLRDAHPERVMAVDWGRPSTAETFPVSIVVHAFDRRGLVRDITAVLADERINIEAMNTVTNSRENTATVDLTAQVHGVDDLSRLLSRIGGLQNVISVRRRG